MAAALTEADTALLLAILNQVTVSSIDCGRLAQDLGISERKTASKRWERLRKKIGMQAPGRGNHSKLGTNISSKGSPSKPVGVTKNTSSARSSFSSSSSFEKGIKEEFGDRGVGMEPSPPVTPIRKLPGRKARVASFKEFIDEDEERDEREDVHRKADEFADDAEEGEDSWS